VESGCTPWLVHLYGLTRGRCVASPVMTAPDSPTRSPLTGVTVLDAMNPGVVSCLPDDGVAKLASIMVAHGIHAVVLARGDRTGPLIVTDLELVQAALERADVHAAEIAREPLASLPTDAPLDRAVAMMAERYVTHLLATDPVSGGPAGIISSFDVAAVVGGQDPKYARMLRPGPARASVSARTLAQARAGDAMHPGVTTCPADATLAMVALSMAEHRIHCVAVAGIEPSGQHLKWGLIGDMDLVLAVHRGAFSEPAATIAATEPIAVREDDSLERVAALMVEHATSHVVVVARSGLPSGIVSTRDLAGVLAAVAYS
jgi:CBS domain-containing protein